MIRFTLLQARMQLLLAFAGLVLLGIILLLTNYDASKIHSDNGANPAPYLYGISELRMLFGILVIATPGLIGVFWGAPLVAREFENATNRLVWIQSVTPTRWLFFKLVGIGL